MTATEAELLLFIFVLVSAGAITGKIASDRALPGHPALWFVGGFLLCIVALPLAIFSKPDPAKVELKALGGDSKKCPKCAELVKKEAVLCRFCSYEFSASDDWRLT